MVSVHASSLPTAVYSQCTSAMSPVLPSESPAVSSRSSTGSPPRSGLRQSSSLPHATMMSPGVVGWPCSHTISPALTRASTAMSARYGMKRRCTYRSSLTCRMSHARSSRVKAMRARSRGRSPSPSTSGATSSDSPDTSSPKSSSGPSTTASRELRSSASPPSPPKPPASSGRRARTAGLSGGIVMRTSAESLAGGSIGAPTAGGLTERGASPMTDD
mmetsp:Transcript_40085/g.133664  ORF Transcript_40085/g.133664 Transcript_40085/m.133664 type:complete len:217 (-) Transcript_40085:307-957(-)